MVKNKLAIFMALAISVSSIAAFAQNDGGSMRGPGQGGDGGQDRQQRFEAHKADILSHLQQAEACVKAATDAESLRACRPTRGEGGGPQDQQGGGGGSQDQQGGGGPQGQQGHGGAMGGGMGSGDAPPPPSDGNAD